MGLQRAVVFFELHSDAECTSLNGHCARESAVFVLVLFHQATGDREQYLWMYWHFKAALSSGLTVSRWWLLLQEVWAGGGMKNWHCCISYLVQVHWCAVCKHKFPILIHTTDQLSIHTADNCLLPLLFLRSLSILSCSPIINICNCLQDMNLCWIGPMAYHAHTGFHYSKLCTYLPYDCGKLSNISGMGLGGSLSWRIWYR
jgi:hypothetical protein